MVQECLTNIHRHSGGASAVIRAHEENDQVFIEVEDTGKGISIEKQIELSSAGRTGVGFRGMRERLRQLGGTLEIRSGETGTIVIARVPLRQTTTSEKAETEFV